MLFNGIYFIFFVFVELYHFLDFMILGHDWYWSANFNIVPVFKLGKLIIHCPGYQAKEALHQLPRPSGRGGKGP